MAFRFEFDAVNKILLMRFEGRLTDESVSEFYPVIREYSIVTDARAGIWDLSLATEFALSAGFIRQLASTEPAMPDSSRPRFVVVPVTVGYGLMRMFEIAGEPRRPRLTIVRTRDEALAALGVQSP